MYSGHGSSVVVSASASLDVVVVVVLLLLESLGEGMVDGLLVMSWSESEDVSVDWLLVWLASS